MNEPNPWQITYGTPVDEWADRISTEFIRIKAERDEAPRLALFPLLTTLAGEWETVART